MKIGFLVHFLVQEWKRFLRIFTIKLQLLEWKKYDENVLKQQTT